MDAKIDMNYYYNNVPNKGLCRNNLIYTSLMNNEQTVFCQWYHNDSEYHKGKNEVVDSAKMDEKWRREVSFLKRMQKHYPQHVPEILDIDYTEKKIMLRVEGPDFWELAGCLEENYDSVLPSWKEQMLEITQAHKDLGIYKYSMHPSSYFVVDGKLKSINYFFCYDRREPGITPRSVLSHISEDRRKELLPKMADMGIELDKVADLHMLQHLCFSSFSNNYPADFVQNSKEIYQDTV
jgi:hypothetical protein